MKNYYVNVIQPWLQD